MFYWKKFFYWPLQVFSKQKNRVRKRLGIRWWSTFFLHGLLKPEGADASQKAVGVNMVMPCINHENHIKRRLPCLSVSHTQSPDPFGDPEFSVLCSESRNRWCLIPCLSPQEKKENVVQSKTHLIYYNLVVLNAFSGQKVENSLYAFFPNGHEFEVLRRRHLQLYLSIFITWV